MQPLRWILLVVLVVATVRCGQQAKAQSDHDRIVVLEQTRAPLEYVAGVNANVSRQLSEIQAQQAAQGEKLSNQDRMLWAIFGVVVVGGLGKLVWDKR